LSGSRERIDVKFQVKTRIGAALGMLLLVSAGWIGWSMARVPRYEGKTLEQWLRLLDPDIQRARERERAGLALRGMGAAALPEVERILSERPKSPLQRIRDLAARWRLLNPPPLPLAERQSRAARAAWLLAEDSGVDISRLVPLLRFHFTNSNYAETEASRALARAGPDGIACLTNLLVAGEPRVRDISGWALALDGTVRSIPGVQDALMAAAESDVDPRTRSNLGLYLSHFRETGDVRRTVSLGCRFLESGNPNDRWVGANLLGAHVSDPLARAALERAKNDPDQRVGSTAARVLQPPSTPRR